MKLTEGRQETRSKLIVVNSSEVAFRLKRGIPPGFRLREAVSSNRIYREEITRIQTLQMIPDEL